VILLDTNVVSALMQGVPGIAASRRATLATRNLRHFEGLGLALVDPWSERG
jgi:predicted nucleic acid-binding protein